MISFFTTPRARSVGTFVAFLLFGGQEKAKDERWGKDLGLPDGHPRHLSEFFPPGPADNLVQLLKSQFSCFKVQLTLLASSLLGDAVRF